MTSTVLPRFTIMMNPPLPRSAAAQVAVVIPCYKVERFILEVLTRIGPEVAGIYVVDDHCPAGSGGLVEQHCSDRRVTVLRHEVNQGVGAAMITGYRAALAAGADVIVKLDGDGQMDPALIPAFVAPIVAGEADYAKGNRFFRLDEVRSMPPVRLFGNAMLSLITKVSSGYWNLFDPTNGYTAIRAETLRSLPLDRISRRYFFETDMLFQLNLARAVATDVPMPARYGTETSGLRIRRALVEFALKNVRNAVKRIVYNYYLRDMSLASIELPLGLVLLTFGVAFGAYHWYLSWRLGRPASAGTVMLSALPLLTGIQFIIAFLSYDISSVPRRSWSRTR